MKKDSWFLVVNPQSGGGKGGKNWGAIQQQLRKMGISYEFAISEYAGHSIQLAKKAVKDGFKKIIAVGGDGTANEVINGIFQQKAIDTKMITFAIIPVGTGNDWVKTHKIPNNYKKAILLLQSANTMTHDIGQIYYHTAEGVQKERFFINIAGLAYDAFVTKATLNRPSWGNNQIYYLYLILRCITQYKPSPISIEYDGKKMEHPFFNITIGQCKYNGGGTQLLPQAIPNDGKFALTLFKDVANWEVLVKAPRFYTGSIVKHKEAIPTKAKHILIDAPKDQPAFVEADGEYLGQTPIEFIMHEKAINIVIP